MRDDRTARAALTRLFEPGNGRIAAAVAQMGAPAFLERMIAELKDTDSETGGRIRTLNPERDLAQAERCGVRFVIPGDAEWPVALEDLRHLTDPSHPFHGPPFGLWVRGPLRLDQQAGGVAVVGSRDATSYGEAVAREIGAGLARAGRCTISGAAFGIDQAAHRGALAMDGASIAVLACGVDRYYPSAHRDLLDLLSKEGAVVSEVPLGTAPLRMRFLARNRVIAALASGTVVVEAALRSGALNTANYTIGLSRPLMGVPGPVTSALSQGVHEKISRGAANLVTCADDVLEVVGAPGHHLQEVKRGADTPRDRLRPVQRQVLDAVPVSRPAGLESIATTAGLRVVPTQSALASLAALGFVEQVTEGWRLGDRARIDLPLGHDSRAYDR